MKQQGRLAALPLLARRQLHVQAAPTHSPLTTSETSITSSSSAPSPPQQSSPLYTTLGQPPSLLQVSLTPSLPTYIQRNSMLSLSPVSNVSVTPYWLSPLKRILFGAHGWRFQKLESTVPAAALVKSDADKSLYVLSMDGKEDFAVFPKSAILSFAGPALRVDTLRVPLKVNRRKEGSNKWIGAKTETRDSGLRRMVGYSLLQGRGDAVLQGNGEVYKLILGVDEEVVVKRDALVGVSITGELDCTENWSLKTGPTITTTIAETSAPAPLVNESTEVVPASHWPQIKSQLINASAIVGKFITRSWSWIASSRSGYLKILGPRTILLQSGTELSAFNSLAQSVRSGEPISVVEQKIGKEAQKYKTEDLLSYAVVKDGKVTFHSTPDFSSTVEKLEKAGARKDVN